MPRWNYFGYKSTLSFLKWTINKCPNENMLLDFCIKIIPLFPDILKMRDFCIETPLTLTLSNVLKNLLPKK